VLSETATACGVHGAPDQRRLTWSWTRGRVAAQRGKPQRVAAENVRDRHLRRVGDLTHRSSSRRCGTLSPPARCRTVTILCTARTPMSDDAFRAKIRRREGFARFKVPNDQSAAVPANAFYAPGDPTAPEFHDTLRQRLEEIERRAGVTTAFYLSTPPSPTPNRHELGRPGWPGQGGWTASS